MRKKENRENDLKYIYECCEKYRSELNEKWVDAKERKFEMQE